MLLLKLILFWDSGILFKELNCWNKKILNNKNALIFSFSCTFIILLFSLFINSPKVISLFISFPLHVKIYLSLSYSNGKFQSQLSYSSKVNRPSYYQLSNYVQYDNQFTYEGGNPLLQPSVSYNVELNVMYGWLQFSSLYQYRKRAILDVGQLYDNESDILLFSPINVKCNKLMVITLSASPVIGIWHPTFEFLLQKQFFDAKRYGVNEPLGKPAVGLNFRNQVAFPHDWILSLDAFYTSTFNYGFSRIYETKNLNIGVTKELFDKKLYLKVAVDDIFYSSREKVDQFYQIAFSSLCRKSDSRRLTLTVTYRFNSTGSKYRGTGAGMSEKQRM